MSRLIYFIIPLFILIFSCEQKVKKSLESTSTNDTISSLITSCEKRIDEIEMIAVNQENVIKSLVWELWDKKLQKTVAGFEIEMFVNSDDQPLKIVEYFTNELTAEQGQVLYYFDQSEIFAVIKKYDSWTDTLSSLYNEKEVFYINGKPIEARIRTANFIDDIESTSWRNIRPENISNKTQIKDVLNGTGKFRTHFISYIDAGDALFLLLGEPNDDYRYQTTVKVTEMTPFIRELLSNAQANRFKEVLIQYGIELSGNGAEFRVLKSIGWPN